MEKKGYVFDDNSSEIIGQKIDYEVANPEDSAIGTITTEQSEKIRVLTPEQIEAMGLPQGNYSQNMTTGEIKLIDEQTDDLVDDIEITDDMIEGDTPAERVKEFVEKNNRSIWQRRRTIRRRKQYKTINFRGNTRSRLALYRWSNLYFRY